MSSKFSLLVSMPDEGPVVHDLADESLSLGRGPDNDIQVLIAEVSVKHGELKAEGDGFKIVDLGSTNGTLVNGAKVGPAGSPLRPMDKVLLGATISAYFVPTVVLASTPAEELIASIEAAPKSAPAPGTAKVAVAVAAPSAPGAPAAPMARLAVAVPVGPGAAGATTVKLDQVRPGAPVPGPVRPPGVGVPPAGPPAAPRPVGGPPAPGAPLSAPAVPTPGGPPAPRPVSPVPLKRPGTEGVAPPSVPLPGPPRVKPD